ncbi:MAG TPA: M20/M25/M40 family metallo-hydrolase [Gemmatimonadales bacterium]|nr:M20/M25/M40 family metallo-hydrolase [Gemmatimonadales bacterium]
MLLRLLHDASARVSRRLTVSVVMLLTVPHVLHAQASADDRAARAIFAELVGINTTHDHGSTTPAARAVRRRLLAAGWPARDIVIAGAHPARQNLVARLRGSGARRPILLLAHLDVVEARRDDWSLDPFTLTEKDGYFYGRGTSDIKDMAAIFVQTVVGLKRDRVPLDRDVILALTADEEGGDDNGVQWLLANRRALIDAAYVINGDGGDPLMRDNQVYARNVQASEKVYMDLRLEVRNPGGHSSLTVKDNAIYRLSAALTRLAAHEFPARLNEVTRAYFSRAAAAAPDTIAARMRMVGETGDTAAMRRLSAGSAWFNAALHTTCVATRLEGGHASNALPQVAAANVNCRMLPDEQPEEVVGTIRRVVADTSVHVTVTSEPVPSPPSPLIPEVLEPVDSITASMWPGAAVVPSMETGATDGLFFRNAGIPVYGVSGVALEADDIRAHGQDERIRVEAFYRGLEFTRRLVQTLASEPHRR